MLSDADLLSSEVVVNAAMNRGRGLSGVNSYVRELRFDIAGFLARRVAERGRAAWYDACCGEGRALLEAASEWSATDWGQRVHILGVDLWDDLPAPVVAPGVRFAAADVVTFDPGRPLDLVTCVHGLHYLGDKLAFLERAYALLDPGGLLVAHLDAANLRCKQQGAVVWPQVLRRVRKQGVDLTLDKHVLRLRKNETPLRFGAAYGGATVSERPNCSGMVVVDSWYDVTG